MSYRIYKYFLPFSRLVLSFDERCILKFWIGRFIYFFYYLHFWCHIQELFAKFHVMVFFPTLSSKSFIVWGLTFRSLIHWVNFCMWCKVRVYLHSFECGYCFSSTIYWNRYSFPIGWSRHSCWKSFGDVYTGLLLGFYFIPLAYSPSYMCVYANTILITVIL